MSRKKDLYSISLQDAVGKEKQERADEAFKEALVVHHRDRLGLNSAPCTDNPRMMRPPLGVPNIRSAGW